MRDNLSYSKCHNCYGTGRIIFGYGDKARAERCGKCDGTGNAFVDGETERHKRRLAEIDARIGKCVIAVAPQIKD